MYMDTVRCSVIRQLTGNNSKKQRIWAVVSDGKYSPDQIASIVGTTAEYVWKETREVQQVGRNRYG